jgi:hypothetical protein
MPDSELVVHQVELDEHLQRLRTTVLYRLACKLGLSIDKKRLEKLVRHYDDTEVWRHIEQAHARGFRRFLQWFYRRVGQRSRRSPFLF